MQIVLVHLEFLIGLIFHQLLFNSIFFIKIKNNILWEDLSVDLVH